MYQLWYNIIVSQQENIMKKNEMFKSLRKSQNFYGIDVSPYAKPSGYLDTGSYAINRVLTGDIHKGIPMSRVTTLYGESQSGKSLLAANVIITAINSGAVDKVIYYDNEGGSCVDMIRNGVKVPWNDDDPPCETCLMTDIEDFETKLIELVDASTKAYNEWLVDPDNNDNIKTLVVVDSFGGLKARKVKEDALKKGVVADDMGREAKIKKRVACTMGTGAMAGNLTFLVINYSYENPGAMFTSKIKNMAGGSGLEYYSELKVQCEKVFVKSDDDEFLTGVKGEDDKDKGFYKGTKFKFFVTKARTIKPFYQATVFLDFNTGLSRYDGLIEDAVKMGYLQDVRGGYICPTYSDKRVTYRDLVSKSEIWDTFIEDFNKKSIEVMSYSNNTSRELDNIEKEIGD